MSDYPHDVLAREPIDINDTTTLAQCEDEVRVRLEALMTLYGCDASAEGWRSLATKLAMEYVPAFRVTTPFDRKGPGSGAPVGMQSFRIRAEIQRIHREGATVSEAAKIVAKRHKISAGRARNIYYEKGNTPDAFLITNYSLCAHVAIENVADELSQEIRTINVTVNSPNQAMQPDPRESSHGKSESEKSRRIRRSVEKRTR